jgi:uncharacterized protein (TIGR02265 family)
MPADRKDLAARIAAATPSDTSRGLNYGSAFGLIQELASEDAARACDPRGTGTRADLLSYPITEYLTLAWNAADVLEQKLGGVDRVFFQLGARTVADHLRSLLGRTLYAIAGHDIRRVLSNVPIWYRGTVSYGERTVEWLGERRCRITFERDFLVPGFHCGVIQAGIEGMGGGNVRVAGRETGFLDSAYDVSWE